MALVRDVVERHNSPSQAVPRRNLLSDGGDSSKTGFPTVQHRSKGTSAFKRARVDQRVQKDWNGARVILSESNSKAHGLKAQTVGEDPLPDISRSNAEAVEKMTEEERERGRQEIFEYFGPGIGDLMEKAREARARRANSQATDGQRPPRNRPASPNHFFVEVSGVEPLNTSSSTAKDSEDALPLSRPARRIRFLDPTEADIHVYESHPPSPKRTLGLLPPPSEIQDKSNILFLGSFKSSMLQNPSGLPSPSSMQAAVATPEEGTPEDIRRRFFPSELPPEDNPALTWMLPSHSPSSKPTQPEHSDGLNPNDFVDRSFIEPRYSLSGTRLSPSQIQNLPTHLGLHHHASSSASLDTPAGYTLSDLLLLARSSVPAQRASILGVLAKILQISREESRGGKHKANYEPHTSEQVVDMDAMRRDVLDAAIDALGEKGGVGQRAMDLLWEALVGFTYTDFDITDLNELPCVDLTPMSPSKPSSPSSMSNERTTTKFSRHSVAILVALPVTRILPALKIHLINSPSPLSLTHSRILHVLFVLSHFSQHARTIVSSDAGVIGAMMGTHLQPPDSDSEYVAQQSFANTSSIRVLQVLAQCGRDVAATLTGPANLLLRYIMTPLPPFSLAEWRKYGPTPSLKLLTETLVLYTLLAQYGIYANVATIAQNEFTQIGNWILTAFRVVDDPAITWLACAYLKLLDTLIVCATDPHMTTPSHDILWSQVRGWGWIQWTLDFTEVAAAPRSVVSPSPGSNARKEQETFWTTIFHTLASCVEGASVNGVKHGEEERRAVWTRLRPILEGVCTAQLVVLDAITRLQVWKFPSSSTVPLLETLHTLADTAGVLAAVTRLALACLHSEEGWAWKFPGQDIHDICMRFMEDESTQGVFSLIVGYHDTMEIPEDAHAFVRVLSSLLFFDLQLWRRSSILSASNLTADGVRSHRQWTTQALRVLHICLPGDEHYAKWIFECLCNHIDSKFVQEIMSSENLPDEQWKKGGMTILLPFLTHSLRPMLATGEDGHENAYIAPIFPTPESISHCTKLFIPSLSHLRDAWMLHDQSLVFPMRCEWPTWPLNHLLRSGSSPVFRELPPTWDATETDVVRASLLLACIVQELSGRRISHFAPFMSRSETIFACMKVFMLEHEQQQLDSGEEVFRDLLVTRWMDELLKPFTYAMNHSKHQLEYGSSLERVSEAFLNTPFFQFYTDFLALYDAISFSHPLFGRLLLPPISMSYAADYRKLLFGDYGHAIRTISTGVGDLICEDVREYLWPVEDDGQILGWYLKTLLGPLPSQFIRWMAVHHLALNIWSDFRDGDEGKSERASKLLSAVVRQGAFDVVRDIAFYRQFKDEVWEPPKCYKQMDGGWVTRRLDFVEHMGDQRVKEQLHELFTDIM